MNKEFNADKAIEKLMEICDENGGDYAATPVFGTMIAVFRAGQGKPEGKVIGTRYQCIWDRLKQLMRRNESKEYSGEDIYKKMIAFEDEVNP